MFDEDDDIEIDEMEMAIETAKLAGSIDSLRKSVEILIPLVSKLINRHRSKDLEVRADLQKAYNHYAKAVRDLNELEFFEKLQ